MSDTTHHNPETIARILAISSRLKYLLKVTLQIDLSTISSIRIDSDNVKIDIHTDRLFRFKAKGLQHVLLPDPETGSLKMDFDPALAQGIYAIVDEFPG